MHVQTVYTWQESKNQYAGKGSCDCGYFCTATESCGAAYVGVPSIGVKHALIHLDETETSCEVPRIPKRMRNRVIFLNKGTFYV